MKSYTNLFDQICAFENLYQASKKAERGKRFRHEVAAFNAQRAENILEIQRLLRAGQYPFGHFRTIQIVQPKPRQISAAPYRDRIVHHALINVIGPLFERKFIRDSYANQTGKGTHAALDRCTYYARRFRYVDDALGFSDDKKQLRKGQARGQAFLDGWRLLLNPNKNVIYPVQQGIPFLGFLVFPTHRRLLRSGVKRSRKRLRALRRGYRTGRFTREKINASVQAWLGHVRHGDTWGLRRALFRQYFFVTKSVTPKLLMDN